MVAGDFVHQRVLKDRGAVAQADDVAPKVFSRLQEQPVRALGRMFRRKFRHNAVDLIDAFIGEDLIDVSETALLQREKIAAGVLQIADIVDSDWSSIPHGSRSHPPPWGRRYFE